MENSRFEIIDLTDATKFMNDNIALELVDYNYSSIEIDYRLGIVSLCRLDVTVKKIDLTEFEQAVLNYRRCQLRACPFWYKGLVLNDNEGYMTNENHEYTLKFRQLINV